MSSALSLLAITALSSTALAQSASQPPPPAAAPAPAPQSSSVVEMDPFEVSAPPSNGYAELNSNSLTSFNVELSKLPVSADVFDQTFMQDTGTQTVEEMLQFYSAGAGSASSQPDTSAANGQFLDRNANGSLSLRGLEAPKVEIDGFFPASGAGITGNGITVPYDLEKVEIINGPQALLYGVAGSGGVINETQKQAHLGAPSEGDVSFQVDQYGHKQGQIDLDAGTDRVAVRVAGFDGDLGDHREFYGGPIQAEYAQIAIKPFQNTTIRLSIDDATFDRVNDNGGGLALTALSTSNDARNGQDLNYLLATNQLNAAANGGASGAGTLPPLNWNNIDSLQGDLSGEYTHHELSLLTVDTTWTPWLATHVGLGYNGITDFKVGNSQITFDAPNVAANPTGTYAAVYASSAEASLWEPGRQKVARVSALLTNNLFGGAVQSQTILGADATRTDGAVISEYYVQADTNGNPILSTSSSANGYQIMPTQYWSVPNGPVEYPLGINPLNPRITFGGQTYVRAITNDTNPADITPADQEGLTGSGTGDFRHTADIESGMYIGNFSQWLNDKLTTLVGVRYSQVYDRSIVEASLPSPPSVLSQTDSKFTSFTSGVTYALPAGLTAYGDFSDAYNPPGVASVDPYGNPMKTAHGLGEEIGLKDTAPSIGLSGQIGLFHASSQNETLAFTSTIARDINPSGINGIYMAGSNEINVNRESQGVNLTLTAAPGNWRFRLSAAYINAKIESGVSYAQLYNDQFNVNAAGDVTYADGTVVYVNPTFNSKGTIAAPASTAPAGYVPLTLATINNSASPYYASPAAVSQEIGGADLRSVLAVTDPVHGPIATGVTGLPISDLQIAPNSTSPPVGDLTVAEAGDNVSGYPHYALNLIGIYTVPSGWLKGLRLGGSTSISWEQSMYYYYVNGVSNVSTSPRVMLYLPTETVFNGILGYSHKFGRFTFDTQLNVNNMFNHYHVILEPSSFNGWSGPNNATVDQDPRWFIWSSRIMF